MIQILNAEISILAVLLAAVASIILGMVWYGPLFGKMWMGLVGKDESDLKAKPMDYVMNIVTGLVSATILSHLISYIATSSAFFGLAAAFGESDAILSGEWSVWFAAVFAAVIAWAGFTLPANVNGMVWEGRRKKLELLNSMHQLASFVLMALVIAAVLNFS